MRLGLLSRGLAATLLALLACAGLAAAARQLAQDGVPGDITGIAVVVIADMQDGSHVSYLTLHLPNGRRVVVGTDASQLASVRSGQKVRVSGWWKRHPGRSQVDVDGPDAPVTAGGLGCGRAKRCMQAAVISRVFDSTTTTTTPTPTIIEWQPSMDGTGTEATSTADTTVDTGAVTPDPTAGATRKLTQVLPPLIFNPQVTSSYIRALFIPIAAVLNPNVANSAKCATVQPPLLTTSQIRVKVHPEYAGGNPSVGGTLNRCSYQKSRMLTSTSYVTDIVRLPCNSSDNTWSMSSCEFDDFNGWADAADARLRAQGFPLDNYFYKVYLVPGGLCGWQGLAYTGCDGTFDCRAWIDGSAWGTPMVYVHEMGHNFGQDHSSTANDEYGDMTCSMGGGPHDRCYNTPRAWQLGWISVRNVNKTHLPYLGSSLTISFYSQSVSSSPAGIRIDPTGWVPAAIPLFAGYRTANNTDVSLEALDLTDEVHIYQSTISATTGLVPTTILASLAVGQSYLSVGAGVRITRIAYTGTSLVPTAVIVIQRTK